MPQLNVKSEWPAFLGGSTGGSTRKLLSPGMANLLGGALLCASLALQVHLAIGQPWATVEAGEAWRVATAYARRGELGDAYWFGQGPTTHILPIMPIIAGSMMQIFGPGSVPSNLLLLCWALIQVVSCAALGSILFRKLGSKPLSLFIGLLFFSLPVFPNANVRDWRYWEGAAAAGLVVASFICLINVQSCGTSKRNLIGGAVIGATVFMLNPIAGVANYAASGFFWVRKGLRETLIAGAVSGIILVVVITPWALRNEARFHAFIPTRANFGLEFALGFYKGAMNPADPEVEYKQRMSAIHPAKSLIARSRVATLGEVQYAHGLTRDTLIWVRQNPADAASLYIRHVARFLFPARWQFDFYDRAKVRTAASLIVPLISLLALVELVRGLLSRSMLYPEIAIYLTVTALLYGLVQPVARYMYIDYVLLTFLAGRLASATLLNTLSYVRGRTEYRLRSSAG